MTRPRLALVINSIGMGGAERALERLLAQPGAERYSIRLFLLDAEADSRPLPTGLDVERLDGRGSLTRGIVQLATAFRRWRPDLVVSLLVRSNLAAAAIAPAMGLPVMLCERMHLGSHLAGRYRGWRLRVARALPRLLYRRATRILAVSTGVADNLVAEFGVAPARLEAIPNGFDVAALRAEAAKPPGTPLPGAFAVAVGRLVEAKGMADVILAYARADPPLPLLILGEGPERAALERLIAELALGDRVRLLGYRADPLPIVGRASFLVSGSRNEGFPNALGEAMALGVPVIASDCPSGPAELLGAGAGAPGAAVRAPFGLIAPMGDVTALADAIAMMGRPDVRDALATAAREGIARFEAGAMFGRYWAAFDTVLGTPTDAARSR